MKLAQLFQKVLNFFRNTTLSGIHSIFNKELIQLRRDVFLMIFIVALPILQLLVTGLAIQKDPKHIDTIVCNYDKRNASIELLKAFDNSTYFDIDNKFYVDSEEDVLKGVRKGKFRIGIVIPPDYSQKVLTGRGTANVNIIVDGTHASVAKTIKAMSAAIVQHQSRKAAQSHLLGSDLANLNMAGMIQPNIKTLYNPDLKSAHFIIPGILALIMHMMTILFTSFAIVRERENGTLEQLMVTPIRVSDLMIGKVIPYAVIGFMDMVLTLGVMVWFFSISISGSFWFLCLASIIFIITSLAIGLLISTTCRSQVQAVQLTLGLLLPSVMITGFVFPIDPMPWFIKIFSYCLPLTYYLDIIRGVVIKGVGFAELYQQTFSLIILSTVLLGLCIVRFKKQIA